MSLIYGITIGKYNYKVIKQRIFFLIYRMLLTVLLLHKYQMFTVAVLIIRKRLIMRSICEQNSDMILLLVILLRTLRMHPLDSIELRVQEVFRSWK
jgi:hypothetical protein